MNPKTLTTAFHGFLIRSILLLVEYCFIALMLFIRDYLEFDFDVSKMAISALEGSFILCVLRLIFYLPIELLLLVALLPKTKLIYTPVMLAMTNCGLFIGISILHSIFLLPSPELMVSIPFLAQMIAAFTSPLLLGLFPAFHRLCQRVFS